MTQLTDQERDVARRVADGFTDKQIAGHLRLSHGRIRQIIDAIAGAWSLDRSRNLRAQIARHVAEESPKTA